MRALLFSLGVAVVLLLLAGCEEVMDKPAPAPMADTAPSFSKTVADQAYLVEEIVSLTLPHATGGDGPLTYSLAPEIPGLMFDATTRTLSGAPTMAGTHAMTYTVVDGDENTEESDSASQRFTVTVLAACPTHSVTQIVGDYIVAHGSFFPSGWVFSFRADGTFQINSGAVTINGESEGNYSYDVTTCTLAWRGTEPAAEPSIGITIIGHLGFVAIRGTNEHFVDWNGPDLFCERGTADSSVCINTYSRAGTQPEPEPEPMACVPHPASQILGNWDASGNTAKDDEFYTFRANGTYQNTWSSTAPAPGLDRPPVTRTVTVNGTYSYVAETCLLTWEPEIANIPRFVAWNGSDQFSTKFSPGGFVLTTFDRR